MSTGITTVTLCGADNQTDAARLVQISRDHPLAEWGILFRPSTMGQSRYPDRRWIDGFLSVCGECRQSLHLCGEAVYDFINRDPATWDLARKFSRIQINIVASGAPVELAQLESAVGDFGKPVILPQNAGVGAVTSRIKAANRQIIFDSSSGTGVLASQWPRPVDGVHCIYAGGLGPEVLTQQLPLILEAAKGHKISIDMESRLRGKNDEFSLERVLSVLQIVERMANQKDE